MKKEKTEKQSEFAAGLIEKIKAIVPSLIFVGVIVVAALLIALIPSKDETTEEVEVHRYEGEGGEIVLENSELKFVMDEATTRFAVTNKSSGQVWYSNPEDPDSDPIALQVNKDALKSTMLLTYSTQIGNDTQLDNYKYSIEGQIFDIESGDDYVRVNYTIGKVQKEYVVPLVVPAERMEVLMAGLEDATKKLARDFYAKYDINKLKPTDDKEQLLEKYPDLETTVLYVLRDGATDALKGRFEEQFAMAGYTEEEYREELEKYGIESSSDKPVFNVSVIYRLQGEELLVEVPLDEIEYKTKYPILSLTVLPYFGAGSHEEEGYILLPEGGGSIINFNNGKVKQNLYYANLYGWDMAQSRKYLVHETKVSYGVFGISKGDSSFICMLEDGAAYASFTADIGGKITSYNYVNVDYSILHRDRVDVGGRTTTDMFTYEKQVPQEKIVQRYRFIDSGSYVDMANSYHNYLEAKYGDAFAKKDDTAVPVSVEIVSAVDKVKQVLGVPVRRPLAVTSYQEAKGILQSLSGDGVTNMSVKLSGWANGGVSQKYMNKVKLVKGLGGKKDLKNLTDYAKTNNIDLYLDGVTNYVYNSTILNGFLIPRDAATQANKKRVKLLPFDPVDYAPQNWMNSYYLLKPDRILSTMDKLSGAADKYGAAGVSFSDVGFQLSADYRQKALVTRQAALNQQVAKTAELRQAGQKIMINAGNDYMLGMADAIVNMDLEGSQYSIIDEAVPFYQIALHGYVNYAGQPLNLAEDGEEELLRSAEYGAGLFVTFMDAPITELQNTYYTQYFGSNFEAWRGQFLEIYERYNRELGHTFNQRIVDHQILDDSVTLTVYEDGTKVYVNYRFVEYTTESGQKLPARDYVVVR